MSAVGWQLRCPGPPEQTLGPNLLDVDDFAAARWRFDGSRSRMAWMLGLRSRLYLSGTSARQLVTGDEWLRTRIGVGLRLWLAQHPNPAAARSKRRPAKLGSRICKTVLAKSAHGRILRLSWLNFLSVL